MILAHRHGRRQRHGAARIANAGTAVSEAADVRRIDGAAGLTGENDPLPVPRGIDFQDSGHQRLGIRRLRILENRIRRTALHHLAQVHNGHMLRDMLDQGQIVGDEQIRQTEFLPQIQEQITDLGMDGHVKGGCRLIADDEFRIGDQCPGDGNSLALSAGELKHVPIQVTEGKSHLFHQSGGTLSEDTLIPLTGDIQRLGDDLPHGKSGVQGRIGILEHGLHMTSDVTPLGGFALCRHSMAKALEGARCDGHKSKDRIGQGGFSAAGFAHQAVDLAAADLQIHVLHGGQTIRLAEHVSLNLKVDGQVVGFQNYFSHNSSTS